MPSIFSLYLLVILCSVVVGKLHYNPEIIAPASFNQQQIVLSPQDAYQTQTEYGITQLYKQHLDRQRRSQPIASQTSSNQSSTTVSPQPSNILSTSQLVNNTDNLLLLRYFGPDNSVRPKLSCRVILDPWTHL